MADFQNHQAAAVGRFATLAFVVDEITCYLVAMIQRALISLQALLLTLPLSCLADNSSSGSQPPISTLPLISVTAPSINQEAGNNYLNSTGSSDAASQGVINGKLYQNLPLLRPGETLESIPGMVVTQHSGDGKANQYFLRGYNLDHGTDFATSVDGVPVNMPTNAHGQGYTDLNFLIPELVSTIDYRKGPYYAGDGDFSSAGSADIHYVDTLTRNLANFSAGAFGYRRVLLAGSTFLGNSLSPPRLDDTRLLGALEVMHNDGPWTIPEGFNKLNGLVRLSHGNLSSGWSLDSAYYDARWNSTDQVPLTLFSSGQIGRYSALDPTDGGNTGRAVLSGEWHASDEAGYTLLSAYCEHYRLQLWSDFTFYELRSAFAPSPNLPSDQFQQAENRTVLGANAIKGWHHHLLGYDSITEAGLQLRHDNIDVNLLDTQSRIPFATVSNDVVGETEMGLYLQNTTHWTQFMRTVAGLREQYIAMNLTSNVLPENSGSVAANKLLPKLSVILGPWNMTEFFVNAGRGFHSNDARGVINKTDPSTGLPSSPVPALVGSLGKEIGMRTEMIPHWQSSMAVWSLDSDSELVYSADAGTTEPNAASKRHGVEWDNHVIVSDWLLLDANLAWVHARYDSMNANGQYGNMIPNAVGKIGLLGATVLASDSWSGGVEARYIGSYPLSQDGSLAAPSAFVTNLRVKHALSRDLSLSLDVMNLFNRQYFDIAYQQDYQISPSGPVVPSGITVHPGEPREVRATLMIRY
jgi:hypothetical protein